jgi:hypothetical protein
MIMSDAEATPEGTVDPGRTDRLTVLESPHSTWMFDESERQFCRVAKGASFTDAMEWRPYDRLIIQPDSEAFLVFLDAAGTRLLRARRLDSRRDEGEVTQELSLDELRSLTHPD